MAGLFGSIPNGKKASLVILWKKKPREELTFHFNPEKYNITRSITWTPQEAKGKDMPISEFKGGGASTTSLDLTFDTALEGGTKDVRSDTKKLWNATMIEENNLDLKTQTGEPPHVIFIWGTSWHYEAVITSIAEDFVLFNASGTPIRSTVKLGLTQVVDSKKAAKQNPTSGGIPGNIYTVREGDRLDLIANQFYSKPMMWRDIAEYNNINTPSQLIPGMKLIIPPTS